MRDRGIGLFTIAGFNIRADGSWLFIVTLMVWSFYQDTFPRLLPEMSTTAYLAMALALTLAFFGGLVLHELAHALMARRFGLKVGAITLFVFGGIAELTEDPHDPKSEFWIALAGPLATLAIAGACALSASLLTGGALPVRMVLEQLAQLNITMLLFNLVPAYPLDGGRVLRAAVWKVTGDRFRATLIAASFGVVFGWGLILTGIARVFGPQDGGGLWLILIGMFLLALAQTSRADVMVKRRLGGRLVASVMTPSPVVTRPEALLADVVDQILLGQGHTFLPVVTAGGELVGIVDATAIRLVDRRLWSTTSIRQIMEPLHPDNMVTPDMACEKVLQHMARTGRRKLVVANQGRLAGVVTMADLLNYVGLVQLFSDPLARKVAPQPPRTSNGVPQHVGSRIGLPHP